MSKIQFSYYLDDEREEWAEEEVRLLRYSDRAASGIAHPFWPFHEVEIIIEYDTETGKFEIVGAR